MMHTMKDTISFTEENKDLSIDSRVTGLRKADKMKKRDAFSKELSEKKKSLYQSLHMCYEEGDGSVSSGVGTDDDYIDDSHTNQSLKRMIAELQTLMGRNNITKDKVTNVKVNNVQVAAL